MTLYLARTLRAGAATTGARAATVRLAKRLREARGRVMSGMVGVRRGVRRSLRRGLRGGGWWRARWRRKGRESVLLTRLIRWC